MTPPNERDPGPGERDEVAEVKVGAPTVDQPTPGDNLAPVVNAAVRAAVLEVLTGVGKDCGPAVQGLNPAFRSVEMTLPAGSDEREAIGLVALALHERLSDRILLLSRDVDEIRALAAQLGDVASVYAAPLRLSRISGPVVLTTLLSAGTGSVFAMITLCLAVGDVTPDHAALLSRLRRRNLAVVGVALILEGGDA